MRRGGAGWADRVGLPRETVGHDAEASVITKGALVATGRTSDVYEFGTGSVVKVPRPDVPSHWAAMEAQFTGAVRRLDVPAPEVRDVVEIDGRTAIVFERIDGESMWQQMLARPADVPMLSSELAAIHRRILSAGLPRDVVGHVERMCRKIDEVTQLPEHERYEAMDLARQLPRGAALLHGDLHPGNVLMSTRGPIVIDWFDATIGHPVADVARTSLLIRPDSTNDPLHLPGAPAGLLTHLHEAYLAAMADVLAAPDEVLHRWESVTAVSRLAEGAHADESSLVVLWDQRRVAGASPLVLAMSSAGSGPEQGGE